MFMCVGGHKFKFVCIHAYKSVYVCVCVCVRACACVWACVRVAACTRYVCLFMYVYVYRVCTNLFVHGHLIYYLLWCVFYAFKNHITKSHQISQAGQITSSKCF